MPARLSSASSSLKPNGSTRCSVVLVAAHSRATFPVFGGISGSTRTMCISPFGFWISDFGFVKDLPQHQSVCRRGHARCATIAFGEHPLDFVRWKFTQARLHQRPDDAATHLVEEAVAFDREREQRAAFPDGAARQRAHGGLLGVAGIG